MSDLFDYLRVFLTFLLKKIVTTHRYIEELYHLLGKQRPRDLYYLISNEKTLNTWVYDYFVPEPENITLLKKNEKTLGNFMHSIDLWKSDSDTCLLFGQIMSGITGSEGIGFLIDLQGFIEENVGYKMLSKFSPKFGLDSVMLPYINVKNIMEKVFGHGTSNARNEFMDS